MLARAGDPAKQGWAALADAVSKKCERIGPKGLRLNTVPLKGALSRDRFCSTRFKPKQIDKRVDLLLSCKTSSNKAPK